MRPAVIAADMASDYDGMVEVRCENGYAQRMDSISLSPARRVTNAASHVATPARAPPPSFGEPKPTTADPSPTDGSPRVTTKNHLLVARRHSPLNDSCHFCLHLGQPADDSCSKACNNDTASEHGFTCILLQTYIFGHWPSRSYGRTQHCAVAAQTR